MLVQMKQILNFRDLWACFFFWFLLSGSSPAHGLKVSFDHATFRYDSVRTYAELYYSFGSSSLNLIKTSVKDSIRRGAFTDSLLFDASIITLGSDSSVAHRVWKVPVIVPDTTQEFPRKSYVGKTDFLLSPGNYRLIVHYYDVNDSINNDSLVTDFPIPSYAGNGLESSEIELCSTITQGESNSIFYKNTYDVVPNPSATYGVGMPIIYYYLEVYNIPNENNDSLVTSGYEIRDSFGQVRKNLSRTRKKFGNSSVEVGTVNGSNFKTGTYTFTFTVVDSATNSFATSSKRFFVYNPNLGKPESPDTSVATGAILSSVFVMMGEEQIDREFAEARYISSSSEKDQYENLSGIDAKRQFIYDFWEKRNTDQGLKNGSPRTRYLERVTYANEHFRTGATEGWKTDRGRVYVLYGQPDEIDRHPNETDSKPYEIWYFDSLEGGVSFDFVDRTGFGDYSLVNSTERNEIHDSNWQQYLTQ